LPRDKQDENTFPSRSPHYSVWRTYNELTAGYIHSNQNSREYLILRMLYIAEITSTAIRLNATWALTPAAMSLLRDRYEQTVRFSIMALQSFLDTYHQPVAQEAQPDLNVVDSATVIRLLPKHQQPGYRQFGISRMPAASAS
jgi:hypothetical protein